MRQSVNHVPGADLDADPGAVPRCPRVSVLLGPLLVPRTERQEQRALGLHAGSARTPGAWRLSGTAAWLQGPLPSPPSWRPCLGETWVFRFRVPLTLNHRRRSFSHATNALSPSTRGVGSRAATPGPE